MGSNAARASRISRELHPAGDGRLRSRRLYIISGPSALESACFMVAPSDLDHPFNITTTGILSQINSQSRFNTSFLRGPPITQSLESVPSFGSSVHRSSSSALMRMWIKNA